MTALLPNRPPAEPFYPTGDDEPVAETYDHFYVLAIVLEVLFGDRFCHNQVCH